MVITSGRWSWLLLVQSRPCRCCGDTHTTWMMFGGGWWWWYLVTFPLLLWLWFFHRPDDHHRMLLLLLRSTCIVYPISSHPSRIGRGCGWCDTRSSVCNRIQRFDQIRRCTTISSSNSTNRAPKTSNCHYPILLEANYYVATTSSS